jgi:putative transposase
MPKTRKDRGTYRKIDGSLQMAIKELKRENPSYTVPVIIKKLKHGKIIGPTDKLNKASIYRFIKKEGLSRPLATPKDKRRFEASYPNQIWQCDILHGPKVKTENGQKKSYLCAIIDDHSRLIVQASFALSEGLESLKDCLRLGIMKRGVPQRFYVDNGACYKAINLEQVLAQLGVILTHSRPYTPEGRGKIERWFRYVRQDFLPMHAHKPMTLNEINERLEDWVDGYNDKPHSSIGTTPYERYKENLACVRPAPDHLIEYFRLVEFRRVKKDRSIQINNRQFEVPVGLVNKRIEARFHKNAPDEVEIFFENHSYGNAVILNPRINASIGREYGEDKTKKDKVHNTETHVEKTFTGQLFGGEGVGHGC